MRPERIADTLARLAARTPIDAPAILVAAHPDDETIGAGASLPLFRRLLLVHVTDGAPRNLADARAAGFATAADYAAARRRELAAALAAGGAAPALAELHAPDQEAALAMDALATVLVGLMQRHGAEVVIAHPYEGGHPDHDAACLIAHLAASRAGVAAIIEMTSYHRAADGSVATGRFLPNGAAPVVVALTPPEQARKRAMLDAFATQRRTLAGFATAEEAFRPAPRYDFTAPPHPGALHYEGQNWGMNFPRWQALASGVAA
ncbi:MAG TPA: PIG-L family deacetylase [Acetobacteraceae bacterium]|nr:PIG-L family deacetylase [Acetobacteraceae bacterium]